MPTAIMDAVMTMFQVRDHHIGIRWHQLTSQRVDKEGNLTYKALRKSFFISCGVAWESLTPWLQGQRLQSDLISLIVRPITYLHDDESFWAAVCIDVENKKLYMVDPTGRCSVRVKHAYR